MLTINDLEKTIKSGESLTVEFKSWIKEKSSKDRINLAVNELIAFANAKGGTVYFGIEDDGEVTGCFDYDCQKLIEAIYDKTRPSLCKTAHCGRRQRQIDFGKSVSPTAQPVWKPQAYSGMTADCRSFISRTKKLPALEIRP